MSELYEVSSRQAEAKLGLENDGEKVNGTEVVVPAALTTANQIHRYVRDTS